MGRWIRCARLRKEVTYLADPLVSPFRKCRELYIERINKASARYIRTRCTKIRQVAEQERTSESKKRIRTDEMDIIYQLTAVQKMGSSTISHPILLQSALKRKMRPLIPFHT